MIALDTETTGIDLYHGAQPYMVTTCDENGTIKYWLWDVDPLTREVQVPRDDVKAIHDLLVVQAWSSFAPEVDERHGLVAQNGKFDCAALASIGVTSWPWDACDDTLIASHLLASNHPHDLTSLALVYLGVDIQPYEDALHKACVEARRLACKHFPEWRIAKSGLPDMPSVKAASSDRTERGAESEKSWKADGWLPRLVAQKIGLPDFPVDHPWHTVLKDYSNADSAATLAVWPVLRAEIKRRGLWELYLERRKLMHLAYRMESRGVTISGQRLTTLEKDFAEESVDLGNVCTNIAKSLDYDLSLPKAGRNNSINSFVFDVLKLPILKHTDNGNPSMDKHVLEAWQLTLERHSRKYVFINSLVNKRKLDTALTYMESYRRFRLPHFHHVGCQGGLPKYVGEWFVLHPFLNPCGTDTLRCSSANPNEQNICFDGETELLTKNGWVRADQLQGMEEIAQYVKETRAIEFTAYEMHQMNFRGRMCYIRTHNNIDMLLTPAHRCLLRNRKTRDLIDVRADEFRQDYQHIHAGYYAGGTKKLSPDMVMFLCAVQADGHYQKVSRGDKVYENCGIKFSFKKKRKIDRLTTCLKSIGASYSTALSTSGIHSFYVLAGELVTKCKEIMPDKKFGPWILEYDRETLDLFCEEVWYWDGDYTKRQVYSSSSEQNVNWVQILFSLSGSRAWVRSGLPKTTFATKEHHYVNVTRECDYSLTTNCTNEQIEWNGSVYCVTVPSSYILIRRCGRVSVTGNSKQKGHNLRYCFGPAPGREWWSLDGKNLELRIPAYEAGEEDMIALFDHPEQPPYYGSNHLLNCHTVYPDLWEELEKEVGFEKVGPEFKKRYESTWYQYAKNGGFAVQYGAIDKLDGVGTADKAFHRPGSHAKLKARFKKIHGPGGLNDRCIAFANKHGYVETIPDLSVDSKHGYPLMVTRTEYGRVLPTVPLNYHVQGTACWWMGRAMVRCQEQLDKWNEESGFDGFITMQIHDELVFDLPFSPNYGNLLKVRVLQRFMEQGGEGIGVPTPVSVEYHKDNWAEGEEM